MSMNKSIKLVQADEAGTRFFIGVADEDTKKVTPVIHLKKSEFISNATFNEILANVKIVVKDGYVPTVKEIK